MARGFAGGLIWGIVVVGGGLAVLSQVAPLPQPAGISEGAEPGTAAVAGAASDAGSVDGAASVATPATASGGDVADAGTSAAGTQAAGPAVVPPQSGTDAGGGQTTAPVTAETGGQAGSQTQAQTTAASQGVKDGTAAPAPGTQMSQMPSAGNLTPSDGKGAGQAVTDDAAAVPQPAEPVAPDAVATPTDLPQLPDVPAQAEAAPALSSLDAALTTPAADPEPKAAQAPAPDPLGSKDALLVPSQGAGLTEPSRLPQIAAAADPGLTPAPLPLVQAPAPDDAQPEAAAPLAPRVLAPDSPRLPVVKGIESTLPTTLHPTVPGVATNALPHVGDQPKADTSAGAVAAADQPLVKYARSFEGAGGKPLFAILLHDVGGAGMSRADLANLPFPVTFVIDPLATDAKEAEAAYRAAGQEVLMLANGLPPGATAGDVAQTFQTLGEILPQAVGVIDMETLGFQDNRALSALVLPVIADQGRGLVTYDQGLNAADQIARRDGLPAAVVFRRLDGAGESQPTIRRYLDRAAFKAAQVGSVVVLGDTRADTVAALLQWAIEGKGATVALAPVTAVMARP